MKRQQGAQILLLEQAIITQEVHQLLLCQIIVQAAHQVQQEVQLQIFQRLQEIQALMFPLQLREVQALMFLRQQEVLRQVTHQQVVAQQEAHLQAHQEGK